MNEPAPLPDSLKAARITFVIARRPLGELASPVFEPFVVNGKPVREHAVERFPAGQGIWIDVGTFEMAQKLVVRWAFKTEMEVPHEPVRIAYCLNFNLQKLQTLEVRELEPFTSYSGEFTVDAQSLSQLTSTELAIPGNPPRVGVAGKTGTYLIAFDNGVSVTLEKVQYMTTTSYPNPPVPSFRTFYSGGQQGTAAFQLDHKRIIGVFLLKEDLNG